MTFMEEQRYPVNVRLIGVMHKKKSKMYMTSVLWSDQNDIIVYRTFKDFKTLNEQMKKIFPPANPLKKSDRIIPRFRDWKMKINANNKGPSKSVVQLKFLEKYCSELLSCDPRVSQCPELIRFFHPKDQELQPEFAKNSIVIMPSEDSAGHDKSVNVGNVTQPFVTEAYRCMAPYETKDTKNRPFKVAVDENVDVLIKDKAGWWLVENEDKRMAWFPAPYLEKVEGEEEDDDRDGSYGESVLYSAVRSYKATNGDEVSVDIGSVVEVLQKSDNGWWLIRYNGKTGYVPAMYLQPYNNPRVRLAALNLAQLQLPGSSSDHKLAGHSHKLSRSQGNLLQLPGSFNVLSEPRPSPPPVMFTTPAPAYPSKGTPTPTVMVEVDREVDRREYSLTGSKGSMGNEGSMESEGSDFSFSDDGVSEGRMVHGRSDPNLFKMAPTTPKVPPRPRAQEILTRCTTVTRKKASKASLSPAPAETLSR
ncbi:NADPH oxidase organizer 1-like [Coregonus clupeaformis]|uniref:NADPH oxidase organizer 1-like n=1 Tax=Coregonus clupeaformis TaxID=59861 RepID=UPI001E1C25F8|nr:NADPH oxidase organizer 1-like [Coregonus clupeaformis]